MLAEMDAISWSALLKVDVLSSMHIAGCAPSWSLFCGAADPDLMAPGVKVVATPWDVLADRDFGRAVLHVYEYGIHYSLLNTAYFRPHGASALGVFHNVTPPSLGQSEEQRWLLERSLGQIGTLAVMDHVACDSAFNRQDLIAAGLSEDLTSVLSLPMRDMAIGTGETSSRDIDLLYVGRLVGPKGIDDLLGALLRIQPTRELRVVLAGNPRFSDTDVIDRVRALASALPRATIEIAEAPTDVELARLYARARIFVMPSHHEGFCVPVLEALSAGCFVVGSDAGNIPEVIGSCGLTYPSRSVDALAGALATVLDAAAPGVTMPAPSSALQAWRAGSLTWDEAVRQHLDLYSSERFRRGFIESMACALDHGGNTQLAEDMRRSA